MRAQVLSLSRLESVAAFCVSGGWLWNLTSPLQREPSGKEEAEASLRAESCIAGAPASLTQGPQLWSKQGHHKTERRCRGWTGTLCPCLSPLGDPEAAGSVLQRPSPTWEVD